jgi:hypothetical protein
LLAEAHCAVFASRRLRNGMRRGEIRFAISRYVVSRGAAAQAPSPQVTRQRPPRFHTRGMLMNPPTEDLRHIRAEARADLVRRLLAVAISVGVAATLAKMSWVQNGRLPDPAELNQTIALGTALAATILSWDGPLLAMPQRPLFGFGRFLVDVALVFVYMFLLMARCIPAACCGRWRSFFWCTFCGTC